MLVHFAHKGYACWSVYMEFNICLRCFPLSKVYIWKRQNFENNILLFLMRLSLFLQHDELLDTNSSVLGFNLEVTNPMFMVEGCSPFPVSIPIVQVSLHPPSSGHWNLSIDTGMAEVPEHAQSIPKVPSQAQNRLYALSPAGPWKRTHLPLNNHQIFFCLGSSLPLPFTPLLRPTSLSFLFPPDS